MGVLKGMKAINEHAAALEAERAAREAARGSYVNSDGSERKKVDWFTLKNDGDAARVVFPQEVDEGGKNYDPKRGISFQAVEHSNPDNFLRKALCSIDDQGACWACERRRVDGSKELPDGTMDRGRWKQVTRFYTNVLVEQDDKTWKPFVMSQGTSEKSITPALFEIASPEAAGTVTDKIFKIKRNGKAWNKTSWLLTPLADHNLNLDDYELFDLDTVVRDIPYAQQEAFYLGGSDNSSKTESAPQAPESPANEW